MYAYPVTEAAVWNVQLLPLSHACLTMKDFPNQNAINRNTPITTPNVMIPERMPETWLMIPLSPIHCIFWKARVMTIAPMIILRITRTRGPL